LRRELGIVEPVATGAEIHLSRQAGAANDG